MLTAATSGVNRRTILLNRFASTVIAFVLLVTNIAPTQGLGRAKLVEESLVDQNQEILPITEDNISVNSPTETILSTPLLDGESFSCPTLPPSSNFDDDGIVYIATRGEIRRSRDFYSGTPPTWTDINASDELPIPTGTAGGIIEFVPDPGCAINQAWVAIGDPDSYNNGSIWRTQDLDAVSPTWTETLSLSDIQNGISTSTVNYWVARLQAVTPPAATTTTLVTVVIKDQSQLYIGRSRDYGDSWEWSGSLGNPNSKAVGLALSANDPDKFWVGVGNQVLTPASNTLTSFSVVGDNFAYQGIYDLYAPPAASNTVYAVVNGGTNTPLILYKSENNGSFDDIFPVPSSYIIPQKINRILYGHLQQPEYLFGSLFSSTLWVLATSTDGGQNFSYTPISNIIGSSTAWGFPANTDLALVAAHYDTPGAYLLTKTGNNWTNSSNKVTPTNWNGTYSGAPGQDRDVAPVTIVDVAAIAGLYPGADASKSSVSVTYKSSNPLIANNIDYATATVTLKNSDDMPLAGRTVSLEVIGSENTVTGPTPAVTDANGQTTFTIKTTKAEEKDLIARSGSAELTNSEDLVFSPGPLSTNTSQILFDRDTAPANGVSNIRVSVFTGDEYSNPILNLPATLEISNGQTSWGMGPVQTDSQGIAIFDIASDTVSTLTVTGYAGTNLETLIGSVTLYFQEFDVLSLEMTPDTQATGMNSPAVYTLTLQNTGIYADHYQFSLDGLDTQDFYWNFATNTVSLAPGGIGEIELQVTPTSCISTGDIFTVTVESAAYPDATSSVVGTITLVTSPIITLITPTNGSIIANRDDILVAWNTFPAVTVGTLTIGGETYPYSSSDFTAGIYTKTVTLAGIEISGTLTSALPSSCGSPHTENLSFTIEDGIVFNPISTIPLINRGYQQIVPLEVTNQADHPYTLTVHLQNPYPDLIANFVGSGSQDETITLVGSSTHTVNLAVHAQDALANNFNLIATLTAETTTGGFIYDSITIPVEIKDEAQLGLIFLGIDEYGVAAYTATNTGGYEITDLQIRVVDPDTGEPARAYTDPDVSHRILAPNEGLDFSIIPVFEERDKTETDGISIKVIAQGAGQTVVHEPSTEEKGSSTRLTLKCGGDNSIETVEITGKCMVIQKDDWYCTNRPEINDPFNIPAFVQPSGVSSVNLKINAYAYNNDVRPHDLSLGINGNTIGSLNDMIPNGNYWATLPPSVLNGARAGNAVQNLTLQSNHMNGGHYVVATDFQIGIAINNATTFVCAANPSLATDTVISQYTLEPLDESDACNANALDLRSVYNQAPCEFCSAASGATRSEGGPINTLTGGLDYSFTDFSIPSLAGDLSFTRWYSSLTTSIYTTTLGIGWTYSLDMHLIFEEDGILLKGPSANQYKFNNAGENAFAPAPGINGELVYENGQYVFTDSSRRIYRFDQNGKIVRQEDGEGHWWDYNYNAETNLLESISEPAPALRDLVTFEYVTIADQTRLSTITNQTRLSTITNQKPAVYFAYTSNGDLLSAEDVLGNIWVYTYTASHLLETVSVHAPGGEAKIIEHTNYDGQGRAVAQYNGGYEEIPPTLLLEYQEGLGTVKIIDANGNIRVQTYNGRGALDREQNALGGIDSIQEYDSQLRPTKIENPSGSITTLAWSNDGINLTQVVDTNNNVVTLDYDDLNNLTKITDPLQYETKFGYDGKLLTVSTNTLGHSTVYTYTTGNENPPSRRGCSNRPLLPKDTKRTTPMIPLDRL